MKYSIFSGVILFIFGIIAGISGSLFYLDWLNENGEKCKITVIESRYLLNGKTIGIEDLKTNLEASKIDIRKKKFREYELTFEADAEASKFNDMFIMISSYGINKVTVSCLATPSVTATIDIPPYILSDSKVGKWQDYRDETVDYDDAAQAKVKCAWVLISDKKIRMQGVDYNSLMDFRDRAPPLNCSRYIIISKVKSLYDALFIASVIQGKSQSADISIFSE